MKGIALLGSTGSIGTQTLDVIGDFPGRFDVHALAAGRNLPLLEQQIEEFRPFHGVLRRRLGGGIVSLALRV